MELIFEGPENIDIFLMKDSNYRQTPFINDLDKWKRKNIVEIVLCLLNKSTKLVLEFGKRVHFGETGNQFYGQCCWEVGE